MGAFANCAPVQTNTRGSAHAWEKRYLPLIGISHGTFWPIRHKYALQRGLSSMRLTDTAVILINGMLQRILMPCYLVNNSDFIKAKAGSMNMKHPARTATIAEIRTAPAARSFTFFA